VELAGARYVPAGTAVPAEAGGFDLVVEATGAAEAAVTAISSLRRGGVACILGLDARPGRVELERTRLGVDLVLQNQAVFGSVNAHPQDWADAVGRLTALNERWPDLAGGIVGLRVPPERFADAFAFRGAKSTLQFG
jgi:threonine dehydrogenase-like Zn-dependent dehydrogenase